MGIGRARGLRRKERREREEEREMVYMKAGTNP
jgi:hypothetical protein